MDILFCKVSVSPIHYESGFSGWWIMKRNGPPHGKTNKMACVPSEDSDQPGHLPSLISLRCPHEESLGP